MLNTISIDKLHAINLDNYCLKSKHINNNNHAMSLNHEFMRLGFVMSSSLYDEIRKLSTESIYEISNNIIPILKRIKGDHVKHKPFYVNFPTQVIDATDYVLFINQMIHYWTSGKFLPSYTEDFRKFDIEIVDFITLNHCTTDDIFNVFTTILKSNESISSSDLKIIEYMMDNYSNKIRYPENIPYKENLCVVVSLFLKKDASIIGLVKTATDILRVATYLSNGDITLTTNTKFKSFSRKIRRHLIGAILCVASEEDIKRHKNKWVKLFHILHVGDYSDIVYKLAQKPRENKPMHSIRGTISKLLLERDIVGALKLYTHRSGDFARNLASLLRDYSNDHILICEAFNSCVDKVSTRVLLQIIGHFNNINNDVPRLIFPKTASQKIIVLKKSDINISNETIDKIIEIINKSLINRFSILPDLGKVYIDECLKKCPIPAQMRSTSKSFNIVARGTHLKFEESANNFLRMFVYWVGQDIDLSATLHDENFNMINNISYHNLRIQTKDDDDIAYHSGDITQAPKGASEFIDLNLSKLRQMNIRYIVMEVIVFSGTTFDLHKECFAGWMFRKYPSSNEIFQPKTVVNKFDITAKSMFSIPVIFDIVENESIWCDTVFNRNNLAVRNILTTAFNIKNVLKSMVSLNKYNLYDLFNLHCQARKGVIVENIEEADIVFSINKGVTPMSINEICANYII